MKEKIKDIRKYSCGYCNYEFEQEIGTLKGNGKHSVSNQVKCRRCSNFLKNSDGKPERVYLTRG